MTLIEFLAGLALLGGSLMFMRIAAPKNGVTPEFMKWRGAKSLAAGGVLYAICIGGTLTIHALLTVFA